MNRIALLAVLLAACSSAKPSKGPSRREAKEFLDHLAGMAEYPGGDHTPELAMACASIPSCAGKCGLGLNDYATYDRDSRTTALFRSCEEASSDVLGNAAAFGPEGPTPDAIDRGVADFLRRRTAAFADRARAALPEQDRAELDRVRVALAL